MSVVHYGWELGAGYGHSARAALICAALQRQGHTVHVSVNDPVTSAHMLAPLGIAVRPAPVWRHLTLGAPATEANHAEVLLKCGYLEPGPLAGLVAGWLALLTHPWPDLVVADYAPSAILASRILGIPSVAIGNGFAVPPAVSPLPSLNDWERPPAARLAAAEARVLASANRVLAAHGADPLTRVCDLLRGDQALLCTWPELDSYGRPPDAETRWWGPNFFSPNGADPGARPAFPAGDGPLVVAYLKSAHPDHGAGLQSLAHQGCRTVCFIPEVASGAEPPVRHPLIVYAQAPLDLPHALAKAALCVCHGGDGTIGQALLAGVPLLLMPMQGEQFRVSRQVERHGLGLNVAMRRRPTDFGAAVETLLRPDGAPAAARRFAAAHAGFDGVRQADEIGRLLGERAERSQEVVVSGAASAQGPSIQIEVTTVCNYACFYCAGREMAQRHMAEDVFRSVLDRLPPDGDATVSLQGEGEPTLHPSFWDWTDALRARGHRVHTITNGTRVDVEACAEKLARVGVSIDTLDPAESQRIGRPNLPKVLAHLQALVDAMGPARVVVHTVDYGQDWQPLARHLRALGGLRHLVQPLQGKDDYARRYQTHAALQPRPPARQFRCRFLDAPRMRYYNIDGVEMPCCYIKDAGAYHGIDELREQLAQRRTPAPCAGCRELR